MFDRKASSDKKPRPKTNFLSIKLYLCKKPFLKKIQQKKLLKYTSK